MSDALALFTPWGSGGGREGNKEGGALQKSNPQQSKPIIKISNDLKPNGNSVLVLPVPSFHPPALHTLVASGDIATLFPSAYLASSGLVPSTSPRPTAGPTSG